MNRTIIFTQRVEIIAAYDERRDCADQRISEFIRECGFIPIPSPNDPSIAECIIKSILPVGIVLTGGNSLVKYGGNAPERDATDKKLIEIGLEMGIPIYGFCRGMQSILDYFGNNLVDVEGHVAIRHDICGLEPQMNVNSYHNQACLELSNDELIVVMKSKDGIIEKVKHKDKPVLGTMWHPEREKPFRSEDISSFQRLISQKSGR